MPAILPLALLAALLPLAVALALVAAPYALVLLDLATVIIPGESEWNVAGTSVDFTDLIFLGLALAIALRPAWLRDSARAGARYIPLWAGFLGLMIVALLNVSSSPADLEGTLRAGYIVYFAGIALVLFLRFLAPKRASGDAIPYFELWMVYGTLASVAYIHAPDHPEFSSPIAVAYQVYRYCWKPILYYAFIVFLAGDGHKLRAIIVAILVSADVCAIYGTFQGFSGLEATGPFNQKNGLGGFLVMPFILSLTGLLHSHTVRRRLFFGLTSAILLRGLVSSASRGAFVAAVAGTAFLLLSLVTTRYGLKRVVRMGCLILLLCPVVLALRPNLLERPNVQFLLEATDPGGVDNYQWRTQKRWPFFLEKARNNPWFGVGSDTDFSLGTQAATPHNAYLAVAVKNGIPAMMALVLLVLTGVVNGVYVFRHAATRSNRALGIGVAAALVGLMVHSIVDGPLLIPDIAKIYLLLIAVVTVIRRNPEAFRIPEPLPQLAEVRDTGALPLTPAGA